MSNSGRDETNSGNFHTLQVENLFGRGCHQLEAVYKKRNPT